MEFASNPDGWLVIRGNTGSGKTHLAASITNFLESKEINSIFTFIPDLVDYLRLSINATSSISHESLLKDLMTCDALILDDFGTKSNSSWIDEKIYQILVHRYESKLITILTIRNLSEIPESIISRISDTALVDHIELDSPDYRQTKTQN
jgi:DNA replication protein DnaC